MKIRFKPLLLTTICLFFFSVSLTAQDIVFQIGSIAPTNSSWDIGLKKLAAEWSKVSNGKVKLAFPKSVANSSEQDLIQKLRFSLDGAVLTTQGLAHIEKDLLFLSTPTVITSDEEFDKALNVAIPMIKRKLSDRYEVLAIAKGGWLYFYSNQPVRNANDFAKLRIAMDRSDTFFTSILQSSGIRVVKSDLASMLLQFNSNAIDVSYSSPIYMGALWSQYRKAISYMSDTKMAPFFGGLIINKRAWERVPASLRPALIEATNRIVGEIERDTMKQEQEAIAAMKRNGLTVIVETEADKKSWDTMFFGKVKAGIATEYSRDFTQAIYSALGK